MKLIDQRNIKGKKKYGGKKLAGNENESGL
jgi:hypothetical protein